MLAAALRLAMRSPSRQAAFRRLAVLHVVLTAGLVGFAIRQGSLTTLGIISQILLVLGIVEGAAVIGWRLTQLPKSQALEFLLVTSTSPKRIFASELCVGVSRFLLIQLAGWPMLVAVALEFEWPDAVILALLPAAWGIIAGLGLTAWIYEPRSVRRVGEWIALFGVMVYLVIGVLAAENLRAWLQALPPVLGEFAFNLVMLLHLWNPFGLLRSWFAADRVADLALERILLVHGLAFAFITVLTLRAGSRLVGHFHDRHYQPIDSGRASQLDRIGDRPLTWWAVRRVMEYSGRVNLYLAGGFCLAYAAFLVAGDHWPAWVGRGAFLLFESWGGPAMVATAMAVMAAVPAAYQFGLWDSSATDRARRLELLLLTELDGQDYAHAALQAAWSRGRGYLAAAAMLWIASAVSGRITGLDAVAAALGSGVLWLFAFAVGFRGFATGHQTNGIASVLTIGAPLLLYVLWSNGFTALAAFVPTSLAFLPMKTGTTWEWLTGFLVLSSITTAMLSKGLKRCDADLRRWFDTTSPASGAC